MYELLPIFGGLIAGTGFAYGRPVARVLWVAVGMAAAVLAFTISGEGDEGPLFLLWDLAQATAAAALTVVLARRARRRRASAD